MLYFFTGTDSDALREKMRIAVEREAKSKQTVRISDTNELADMNAVLQGRGMFDGPRVITLSNVLSSTGLRDALLGKLPHIAKSEEVFFMLETEIDAATRKTVEKYAEKTERIDAPKKAKDSTIFAIGNALRQGKRKELWVAYQRELQKGSPPEAIHGILFWAAKQQCLQNDSEQSRALIAKLAILPHEARRSGFDLEYALEHFVLSHS